MNLNTWRNLLSGLVLAGLVSACSSTEEPDYAELGAIDEQLSPSVAWTFNLGDGSDEFYSRLSPVYADGVLYAADRHGRVSAVNADNGRRVWQADLSPDKPFSLFSVFRKGPPARLSGGIVHDNGTLYLGSENGELFALDAASGDVTWQVSVPGEVISAPAVGEGFVIAHLGNGMVVALDMANGEERWRHEEEVPTLSLRGSSSPVIQSGGVVVGTNNGRAAVLILENGQIAWDDRLVAPTGASDLQRMVDIDASPVVRGENVYMLAYNGELIALELRTGDVLWRRDYAGYRTPQVTASRIFLTTQRSHIAALDRINGNERWRNNELYGRSLTEVAVMPNHLVSADRFGVVHWFDRESGQLVGRHEVRRDTIQVAPIRVNDKVIIQTNKGRLIALSY
ncbi:MAG: outer membrane protein assembly factor BamB [Idiomarina sp.]|nr:outer membrane protein assembly factor BamB [Idiomarina sp.]